MREISSRELRAHPELVSLDDERIAVIASYGAEPTVTRSLAALVEELCRHGYQTLLVRAGEDDRPLEWPADPPDNAVVIRRSNKAYDFGSWADALGALPGIRARDKVIFANDSLVGPFAPIDLLIDDFETTGADVWGAVTNPQIFPHIQSFFFGFRHQTLDVAVMREFWKSIRPQAEKIDYVMRYELGMNRAFYSEALVVRSAFGDKSLGYGDVNPTLDRWKELLRRGFPFLKRALLTDPENTRRAESAALFARELYGVDVTEWM